MDWKHRSKGINCSRKDRFRASPAQLVFILLLAAQACPEYCLASTALERWAAYNDGGFLEFRERHYRQAAELLEKAKAEANRSGQYNQQYATSLFNLGLVRHAQGETDQARALLEQSLEIRERVLWPEHPDLAQNYDSLAAICESAGQYERASALQTRKVKLVESLFGPESREVLRTLADQAAFYKRINRPKEELNALVRLLGLRQKDKTASKDAIATFETRAGEIYLDQGDFSSAEKYLRHALAEREKLSSEPSLPLAIVFLDLAQVCEHKKNDAEAEELFKRALAVNEKVGSPPYVWLGRSLFLLGQFYHSRKRFPEAEPLYKRAISLQAQAFEHDKQNKFFLINSLLYLGVLYGEEQRYTESIKLLEKTLALASGPPQANKQSIEQIRKTLTAVGQQKSGAALAEIPAPVQTEHKVSERHRQGLEAAATMERQGLSLMQQNKLPEAQAAFENALRIKERILGSNDQSMANSLFLLAQTFHSRGMVSQAEPLYQRAIAIAEQSKVNKSTIATYLMFLANLYSQWNQVNKFTQAEKLYIRSLALVEPIYGSDSPALLQWMVDIGDLYQKEHKLVDSERYYKRALKIGGSTPQGEGPIWLRAALTGYGKLLNSTGRSAEAEQLAHRAKNLSSGKL